MRSNSFREHRHISGSNDEQLSRTSQARVGSCSPPHTMVALRLAPNLRMNQSGILSGLLWSSSAKIHNEMIRAIWCGSITVDSKQAPFQPVEKLAVVRKYAFLPLSITETVGNLSSYCRSTQYACHTENFPRNPNVKHMSIGFTLSISNYLVVVEFMHRIIRKIGQKSYVCFIEDTSFINPLVL